MRRLIPPLMTPAMVLEVADYVLPEEITGIPPCPHEAFAILSRDSNERSYIETQAGAVVAFGMIDTTFIPENGLVSFWCIRVQPELRRQGVGRRFMGDLEIESRRLGATSVYLFAVDGASRFYEPLGYELVDEQTGLMGKTL